MVNSLQDQVVVVVGGAGTGAGLGQGLVRGFAAEGMRVAVLDLDADAAERLAEELRAAGGAAIACQADVTNQESLERAAAKVREAFGACHVLCAHVGGGDTAPIEDQPLSAWRLAFDLMVFGTVGTVQAFLPLMRETPGSRRIVLTASAAALAPGRFQGPYRSAKAAVTSIGETLDLELGPEGIGATIAFPSGMLAPDIVPLARQMMAESGPPAEDDFLGAVAAEMITDPADLVSGVEAAAAVVDAVREGRRYVVTHGVTVARNARARHADLDQALEESLRRS